MKETKINNNMKDRLFRLIFQEKKDLLELYNAVANRNYKNPELLVITTLDDALYMGMKNDLSFLISDILNLYEHQGSFNPNMPIRGFHYLSDVYRQYEEMGQLNLYGSKLVKLPTPQYVVFYNGTKDEPDRMELKLSDAFLCQDQYVEPCLECKCVMLNINFGHNQELMDRCKRLKDYAAFVHRMRKNQESGMTLYEAVEQAVKTCIQEGILADILSKNRAEVRNLILYEYDEQKQLSIERKEGFAEGEIQGKAEMIISMIRKKLNKGRDISAIAEELELEDVYVNKILELITKYPEHTDLQIAKLFITPESSEAE